MAILSVRFPVAADVDLRVEERENDKGEKAEKTQIVNLYVCAAAGWCPLCLPFPLTEKKMASLATCFNVV